jgi:type II secretory pathway predicted ATPase ExeA
MYHDSRVKDYRGNPLIEALPPLINDASIFRSLRYEQYCLPSEKDDESYIRQKYLNRIFNFVEPFGAYLQVYRTIEDLLLESYASKNPLVNSTQHWLHFDTSIESQFSPSSGFFKSTANSATIVGASGAGKSLMIERILSKYPQKISHTRYKNNDLHFDQIVWIKVNCTENLNVKALLILILQELDRLNGTNDAAEALASKDAIATARIKIGSRFKSTFVGLLVIDEIQNLSFGDSRQQTLFMQFVLNVIDQTGVPILFCGNPEILSVFGRTLKLARRSESHGLIKVDGLNDVEWRIFVNQIWKLQWIKNKSKLTDEMSELLYELSTGLPDFAVKIFRKAQELVIGTEKEELSCAVLRDAYSEQCILSDKGLSTRRARKTTQAETVQDAFIPETELTFDTYTEEKESKPSKNSNKKNKPVADLNRIQHPELEARITKFRESNFLPISEDPLDVVRNISEIDDFAEELTKRKLFFIPSSFFKSGC